MKIRRKEFIQDYPTYRFGYTLWCEREPGEDLNEIYAQGFLPYSGDTTTRNTLYMSRGVRVSLHTFSLNSENRRVYKKFNATFTRKVYPFKSFDITDPSFLTLCSNYFKTVHNIDPKQKLPAVLNAGFITDIVEYKDLHSGKVAGYVFLVNEKTFMHYWFSFYDTQYVKQSLGMWMMINEIIEAQYTNKHYAYLGNGYGEKSRYKTNFNAVEFWDGTEWIADSNELKRRGKTDISRQL